RLKLKEIDGGPHKRWSMWLNSKQREEPYQALTCISKLVKASESRKGQFAQVLHGSRQLVSRDVGLSTATSVTPVTCCHRAVRLQHSVQHAPPVTSWKSLVAEVGVLTARRQPPTL